MKKYWSIFRIRFIHQMQYRSVVFGMLITRFAWAFMEILAYTTIYQTGTEMPMTLRETVAYTWLSQIFFVLFVVVYEYGEIHSAIQSGAIAYELVRPVGLYGRWWSQSAAGRLAATLLYTLPVIGIAWLLPEPYCLSFSGSIEQFALFLLSVVLGFFVTMGVAMLMHIFMFYTMRQRGVRIIAAAVTNFLSGAVIPLPFFPEPIRQIVEWMPFASMQNMPLQIFCGSIHSTEVFKGILLQILWLCLLTGGGRFAMHRALRKVVVQGG